MRAIEKPTKQINNSVFIAEPEQEIINFEVIHYPFWVSHLSKDLVENNFMI